MSRFSSQWLSLREPLDAVSRSASLSATFAQMLRCNSPSDSTIQVTDLGTGTAANLRYLAPLIGGSQDWLLVDSDALLLDAAIGRNTSVCGVGFNCRARGFACDLANEMERMDFPRGGLVTASALLDLVSTDWLSRLAAHCADAAAPVCFALTYDGRIECNPPDPEDPMVRDLFNTHQQSDKGFGPALGPGAAGHVIRVFKDRGYQTSHESSDWRLDCNHPALQYALIEGWFSAARETAPAVEPELRQWRDRRRAFVDEGQSGLVVGHIDMVGWPPGE